MDNPQVASLAKTLDVTRNLTRWYFSRMKEVDMHHRFELDDKKFNSPMWELCHITWAENMLVLSSCGGPVIDVPWQDQFTFGSKPEDIKNFPDIKNALGYFKQVHQTCMDFLNDMPDSALDEQNLTGIGFGEETTKRTAIIHAIRHEGSHCGHLGLLCKMYSIKTV